MKQTIYRLAIYFASAFSLAACGFTTSATSTATSATTPVVQTSSAATSTVTPPTSTATIPTQPDIVQSPVVSGPVILRGYGIGSAVFGQPEAIAISNLEKVLGPPTTAEPMPTTNCTVDAYIEFLGLIADFDKGLFVGYRIGSLIGENRQILNSQTTKGLRIGDTLAQAKQIYGSNLRTSTAQGGSWFAATSTGTVAGLTTVEVNWTNPQPRIADMSAGAVGCPAVSP